MDSVTVKFVPFNKLSERAKEYAGTKCMFCSKRVQQLATYRRGKAQANIPSCEDSDCMHKAASHALIGVLILPAPAPEAKRQRSNLDIGDRASS